MAKGIFALEDLEDKPVTVEEPNESELEPVDETEYSEAENDLEDSHNELDDLQETYDNAGQDSDVIENIVASIPDTDDTPVESTIIATEALIRKLGLPNYSLESYKSRTNKALRVSLEETIQKTSEAKKSLFKKIWEKIIEFLKKAYEFFMGLFKKKVSAVKKQVYLLELKNPEEAIRKVSQKENIDVSAIFKKFDLSGNSGKPHIAVPVHLTAGLLVEKYENVNIHILEKNLDELMKDFDVTNHVIHSLKSDLTGDELKEHIDSLRKLRDSQTEKYSETFHSSTHREGHYQFLDIATKDELVKYIDKIDEFANKIASSSKSLKESIETNWSPEHIESRIKALNHDSEKEEVAIEYYKLSIHILYGDIRSSMWICEDFVKDSLYYIQKQTHMLYRIQFYVDHPNFVGSHASHY